MVAWLMTKIVLIELDDHLMEKWNAWSALSAEHSCLAWILDLHDREDLIHYNEKSRM
jgi:hypothetical protein